MARKQSNKNLVIETIALNFHVSINAVKRVGLDQLVRCKDDSACRLILGKPFKERKDDNVGIESL